MGGRMINAHDIEMMRSEMRKVAADVVSETMASNQPESRSENSFESKPTEIWLDPPKPNITEYLPPPHPFEIVVELDPETSVPTVYVRNGAFVLNEPDGTHKFVATNELTSEAAYTLYEVPNEREADKTIWAKLDMSDTEPVATIEDEQPDDDPDVFYVCIGKVNAYGGIEQYVFGHIPYGGGASASFPWSKLALGYSLEVDPDTHVTTCTIYPGAVRIHGAANLQFSEAGVNLSGTPCWVYVEYTRPTAALSLKMVNEEPVSEANIVRLPLYVFSGAVVEPEEGEAYLSYSLSRICNMGDFNFDTPIQ
jgi:hypothetical protein